MLPTANLAVCLYLGLGILLLKKYLVAKQNVCVPIWAYGVIAILTKSVSLKFVVPSKPVVMSKSMCVGR